MARFGGVLLGILATLVLGLAAVHVLIGSVPALAEVVSGEAPEKEPEPRIDPDLEAAFDAARLAAAEEAVVLTITSGPRSHDEQQALWEDALEQYGSREAAARWVLPPEVSAHVKGRALDVGPMEGAAWLGEHGRRWGLCQVYANEPWHFELTGVDGSCPELLPDASVLLVD